MQNAVLAFCICFLDMEKDTIKISVRSLVEFILRYGDLDSKRGGGMDRDAMLLGGKIHRKIQKSMGAGYRSEVTLRYQKEYDDFRILLEGRADGIVEEEGGVLIDEIKGTFREVEEIRGPAPLHLAQAKCYGWMYARDHRCEKVTVQVTYCHLESEEIRRFQEEYKPEELELWFDSLLGKYYPWASFQHTWKIRRRTSMAGLQFPFPYREGQRNIVASVYHTIRQNKELFVQAPTGVGKTMSVIFPAVRAVGEGMGEKIFYLTARTIARQVAEEAFSILKSHGLEYKVITLTAREKMCVCPEPDCSPLTCPRAKGHFDRVNDAVFELLTGQDEYTRELLQKHSEKWNVCPYEMSLDLAVWADAVICDYNYVFDPRVHLRRFFGDTVKGEYIFLIDEAHNLAERGREMYSALLCKEDVLKIKEKLKSRSKKAARFLNRANRQLLEMKRECDTYQIISGPGALPLTLMNLQGELEKFLEEAPDDELKKEVLEFYFQICTFLNVCDLLDENYVVYTYHDENGRFYLRLFCVNPADNLQQYLKKGRGTVFFSATLLPIGYYKRLLGSRQEEDYAIYVESPFPEENRRILIGREVSSRYRRRGPREYEKIARYIYRILSAHRGNYMVFFPSYQMMDDVFAVFSRKYGMEENIQCLLQSPTMEEEQREEFLQKFEEGHENSVVGFCVMGGIFSEGIDLIGERLIGAVLVGTGIPGVSMEREILMKYYEEQGENGFDYAYRYPGMNKVLQAAGRVIRREQDRGIVALLDERFLTYEYRCLFPREWKSYWPCTLGELDSILKEFWSGGHCS
ncbi:MAG: ATP-dependent DNA helicase [Ruminococcus sp.]|jgi:DNA excision repair protein ERCC-2